MEDLFTFDRRPPNTYSGSIIKLLQICETFSVAFDLISVELPAIGLSDLSTDHNYFYEIAVAISDNNVPTNLAMKISGKMSHTRWFTTSNRILRLYVSSKKEVSIQRSLDTNYHRPGYSAKRLFLRIWKIVCHPFF